MSHMCTTMRNIHVQYGGENVDSILPTMLDGHQGACACVTLCTTMRHIHVQYVRPLVCTCKEPSQAIAKKDDIDTKRRYLYEIYLFERSKKKHFRVY